jgi:hypothetical protein
VVTQKEPHRRTRLVRSESSMSVVPPRLTSVSRALHQYLGIGVGEHLGYLFTGIWSVLIGVAVIGDGTALPTWLGWPGVVIARRSGGRLGGVPRTERRAGMASRRCGDPDPLHRVVPLAARDGHRVDRAANTGFFGSKPFSRANGALIEAGREGIDWRLTE